MLKNMNEEDIIDINVSETNSVAAKDKTKSIRL